MIRIQRNVKRSLFEKKNWNDFEILRNMIILANLASKDVWVLGPPCPSTLQPAHFLHQAIKRKRKKCIQFQTLQCTKISRKSTTKFKQESSVSSSSVQ